MDRQERLQKLSRVKEHSLYKLFLAEPQGFSPSLGEMADLFRCRVDANSKTWENRIGAVVNLATEVDDQSVLTFLEKCREAYRAQALTA